jgi:hypothetical protein
MFQGNRASLTYSVLAGVLVVAFMLQSLCASLVKSAVYDEPPHIASGLSYLETRVFHANPQHPPLLKEMSAVSLLLAGVRLPRTPMAARLLEGGPANQNVEWAVGNEVLASNGPDRVLFWARLPFILLAGLLGALIFLWGRELAGEPAALFALFLYAFDPTMIAHSSLVTTDAGMAAFTVLFLFTLWRYLQAPGRPRLVWCGLALGAALASKFSAVALLPVGAVLLFAGMWRRGGPAEPVEEAGPNSPCPCGSGRKYKKCHGSGGRAKAAAPPPRLAARTVVKAGAAFLAISAVAAVAIEVTYLFSSDPFLYLTGLRLVNADHVASHSNYLHGVLSDHRFPSYFAVAYLLKEPLAAVLAAVFGWVTLLRGRSMPLVSKLFLLLPPAVLFLAYTIGADQWGVRYIIPTLPFAFLAGGIGLAALARMPSMGARLAAGVLCLWTVVAAAGIYPDHLSYFNEMACVLESPSQIGLDGGSRCGPRWLDDSNVDWGQGLKQLRGWLEAHEENRTIQLGYFGSLPPEDYGLKYANMGAAAFAAEPQPGLYAVSAHIVARAPALGTPWMRQLRPKAIVGHAFYVFDVPDKENTGSQ